MSAWRCFAADGAETKGFRSFEAAERWAKQRVRQLDDGGFSSPVLITQYGDAWTADVAWVRLDGADRAWTDFI